MITGSFELADRRTIDVHSAAMSRSIHMLCILLCASLLAAPVSHVHAHVTGEDHVHVSLDDGQSHAHAHDAHGQSEHAVNRQGHTDRALGRRAVDPPRNGVDVSADALMQTAAVKTLVLGGLLWSILFTLRAFMASGLIGPALLSRALER